MSEKANIFSRLPALFVIAFIILGVGLFVSRIISDDGTSALVDVTVPALSTLASKGEVAFDQKCAACHGTNGAGSDNGPPLVHDIYNPGHHGDPAFFSAAKLGVQSHHWGFGDMAPVEGIAEAEIKAIVRYVRELQRANGILYRPHTM